MRVEKLAMQVASGIRAEYWSVSARTGLKIVELFQRIAALAFDSALREAIVKRMFIENSISKQMQKKSQKFGKHL